MHQNESDLGTKGGYVLRLYYLIIFSELKIFIYIAQHNVTVVEFIRFNVIRLPLLPTFEKNDVKKETYPVKSRKETYPVKF